MKNIPQTQRICWKKRVPALNTYPKKPKEYNFSTGAPPHLSEGFEGLLPHRSRESISGVQICRSADTCRPQCVASANDLLSFFRGQRLLSVASAFKLLNPQPSRMRGALCTTVNMKSSSTLPENEHRPCQEAECMGFQHRVLLKTVSRIHESSSFMNRNIFHLPQLQTPSDGLFAG